MGKFDGMDPKLVRELLAEVKHAAGELRSLEGRVTHVMSAAGLPTQTTHRPVQVADAVDTMVHDVSQRLALLEKKNDTSPVVGGDKPTSEQQTPSDHKTPTDDQPKQTNDQPKPTDDQPKPSDDQPKHSGEQAVSGHKTGETADQPKTPDTTTDQPKTPDTTTDQPKTSDNTDQPKTPDNADQPKTPDTGADQPKSTDSDAKTPHLDPHKPHVVVVDGVKVLQVPIDPPTATELNDLIKNIDKIQPHDLPAAATHHPSQVEPGDARPWVNDGSDVVSVNAKPISPEALKDLISHIRDVPPMDMPSVDVPKGEWGHGDWTPKHIQPDGPPGTVDPGAPTHPTHAPGSTDSSPTTTSGTPAAGADGPGADAGGTGGRGVESVAGGVHGPGAGGAGGAEAAGVNPYADDGSDVVSVNAKPLDPDALKTLHDHVREVQPLDMPSVEVPKGEWGKGEWVPKDIQPDGPPGTIDPGAPERSA